MTDFISTIGELEERVDEEAVYVPKDKDSDEYKIFERDHLGLPQSKDDYDIDHIKEIYDGDDETMGFLSEFGHELRLTQSQLEGVAAQFKEEYEATEERKLEELKEYRESNSTRLQEMYGKDYNFVMSEVKKLVNTHGKEFMKEFRGDKALLSKSFVDMMTSIMDKGIELKDTKFVDHKRLLNAMSDDKLLELHKALLDKPYFEDVYKFNSDAAIRKAHTELRKKYNAIARALEQRGIQY